MKAFAVAWGLVLQAVTAGLQLLTALFRRKPKDQVLDDDDETDPGTRRFPLSDDSDPAA